LTAIGYPELSLGLNNQKLALFGLFSTAQTQKRPLTLPQFCKFDAVNSNHQLVALGEVYSVPHLKRFAGVFGLQIIDGPPASTQDGWSSFIAGCERHGRDAIQGTGLFDDFTWQFFRNLVPLVTGTEMFRRLRDAVFVQRGIKLVIQLRIENDWIEQIERLKAYPPSGFVDDIGLSYQEILRKTKNSITQGDLTRTAYIVCDEENLPMPKEEIRAEALEKFGMSLLWKSDILTSDEMNSLSALDKSLIDFEMAARAPMFVGFSRSTFANLAFFESYCRATAPEPTHFIYNCPGPLLGQRFDFGTNVDPVQVTDKLYRRAPLLPDRADDCLWPATLNAYLANLGEFSATTGSISGTRRGHLVAGVPGDERRLVEGFAITLAWTLPGSLEYRAKLSSGEWTPWLPAGSFAGTRGQSAALRGFAVRLTGRIALSYECVCIGSFKGAPWLVQARGGQDCTAENGEELAAMQVIFRPVYTSNA
jgi:hypothetical protein